MLIGVTQKQEKNSINNKMNWLRKHTKNLLTSKETLMRGNMYKNTKLWQHTNDFLSNLERGIGSDMKKNKEKLLQMLRRN